MLAIRRLLQISIPILVLSSPVAAAAGELDLAAVGPGSTRTLRVEPGELDLRIVHRLPGKEYSIEVLVDDLPVPPFTLAGFRAPSGSASLAPLGTSLATGCTKAIEDAFALDHEADVPGLLEANPECADQIRRLTTESVGSSSIERGQRIKVVVTRAARIWTWIFSAGPRGEWRTSYGFTFVPNDDRKYVTRPGTGDESAKFRIFEQDDREELDFVPSVLFSWRPATRAPEKWKRGWSLTGGLGWDLEKPVVLAGLGWTFNENLILTFGVAIHQQTRLLGKYSKESAEPGNLVGEALEPGQLVESTYGPNLYLGVAFRFDTSNDPFKRSLALQQEAAAAEQARVKQAVAAAAARAKAEAIQAACEAEAKRVLSADKEKCLKDFGADGQAAQLAACQDTAEKTEAAARAACPAEVAKKLAAAESETKKLADAAAVKKEKEAEVRLATCKAVAAAELAVAVDVCSRKPTPAEKTTCELEAKRDVALAEQKCLADD